ncbi:MAG TPA: CHAD domain-containing protein [Candidatus Sericytochromatia bacterium]
MIKAKKDTPRTFGDWAYLAIKKHVKHTIKQEPDVLKDTDPEALHQMRVGTRRLRTAVTGFAPAISLPKAAKEQKIAKIARKLGELRDLDVLQDALENQYIPSLPTPEQDGIKKVLASLGKQRKKTFEQVQATLKEQPYQKLKGAFKDWLEQPTYGQLAEISIYDVLPDLLLPSVSELFLHPAWLVGVELKEGEIEVPRTLDCDGVVQLLNDHGDVVHSLRKQAKRVRYQMELFTDFYSSTYQDYLKEIKEIQSLLGEIQDSFVLAEFLTDNLDSELAEQLPTLAAQLTETRCEIWQKWQSLQQRYLDPRIRKDLHQAILQPVPIAEQAADEKVG